MITRSVVKEHLALERRSVTEIATALTIVAVMGSTLYNFGFFAPIEWSLVSLLTVQDLLIGAAVAILPMLGAGWAAWWGARMIDSAPSHTARTIAVGLPLLVLSSIGFHIFFQQPTQSTVGHLACGYVGLGALSALANLVIKSRAIPTAWLLLSLLYIPFSVGVADSLASSGPAKAVSQIETDRGVLTGRVVRITSAYVLLAGDTSVTMLPLSKVKEVRRLYVTSPETDFLSGEVVPRG